MGIVLVAAFAARAGGVLAATMRPARQRLLLHANCRHGSRAGAVGRVRLRCCRAWAKAFAFDRACKRLKLKHIRTRPYTPKTNGKAERFVQTALREWAYAKPYNTSNERAQQLQPWTHAYNWHRPHGSLKANTPISRLGLSEDNLLRLHS